MGKVEIGGVDAFKIWINAPSKQLRAEIAPHVEVAIFQAMASPRLEIKHARAESLGNDTWRVELGVANTGWLGTEVSKFAEENKIVLPITVEISGATTIGCNAKERVGQLMGRVRFLFNGGAMSDGTPDRLMHTWVVRATRGTEISLTVRHPRCGEVATKL
ncbi:MAG: hypothetical protein ACKOQX_10660, partial [Actinomycetota bacterium]